MTLKSLQQYGKAFQLKVLGSLLTDKTFLLNVRDVLYPDYFDADSHKWIISQIIEYFDQYHTIVTMDVLKVELHKVENEVLQVALKEELRNSYAASQDDLDYIQEEFTNFCKNQEMKNAILNSADLLKLGDFDGIRNLVEKAIKAGMDKNIGHEYNKDVETRYRVDYRPTIPTPWPILNEGIQGGFGPGDLGIIFGSPGGGKSWTMVAIAAHAVQLGHKVNYYTLELGEDYVGKRFDCYFTGYSIDEINKHRKDVQTYVDNLKGKLIVKEYPPKGASISTIKAHVQKCIDMEHKPDMIIIDYVDYLRAPSKSKYSERKDEIDDNFIATKGLAKDLKIPILTPSQVNRMGARDSIIEGDKAAGSYDKMMVADVCLSLSRMKEDKVLGTGRIHVMKNRYGQDGMTYNIKMDTNNGHIDFEGKTDPSELIVDESKPTFNLDSQAMSKIFDNK
jgi:replicative DNA helicase|tara:strand:- start:564 stop:1910 length:1347 start_codon:yes stop_codon:yes gene_type:complete